MEEPTTWEEDAVIVEFPYIEIEDDDQVVLRKPADCQFSMRECELDLESLTNVPDIRTIATVTESEEDPLDDMVEEGLSLFTDALNTFGLGPGFQLSPEFEEFRESVPESPLDSADAPVDDNTKLADTDEEVPQPLVSLWNFAGRTIKKNPYGKFLLEGIREGMEDTRKVLGIGVGQLRVSLAEPDTPFSVGDKMIGSIQMELTELDLETEALTICFQGVRQDPSGVPIVISALEKELKGNHTYGEGEIVPFELVIPERQQEASQEFISWDRWIASTLQMDDDTSTPPIEWSITATLRVPGRLSMKTSIELQVLEEDAIL